MALVALEVALKVALEVAPGGTGSPGARERERDGWPAETEGTEARHGQEVRLGPPLPSTPTSPRCLVARGWGQAWPCGWMSPLGHPGGGGDGSVSPWDTTTGVCHPWSPQQGTGLCHPCDTPSGTGVCHPWDTPMGVCDSWSPQWGTGMCHPCDTPSRTGVCHPWDTPSGTGICHPWDTPMGVRDPRSPQQGTGCVTPGTPCQGQGSVTLWGAGSVTPPGATLDMPNEA